MKFAYLIMAHNEFSILEKLMELLDDERNDIYLHIDQKTKNIPESIQFGKLLKRSSLTLIPRHSLTWGGYSQVRCELELLFTALTSKTEYDYYHLISGVDMPLHNQDDIHDFFEKNKGYEFVGIADNRWVESVKERYQVYHLFQDIVGRNRRPLYFLDRILVKIQKPFINRQDGIMAGGSAWFSISNEFAKYLYGHRAWIQKSFKYTACGDEHMIHSVMARSPFIYKQYLPNDETYNQCLRYVDFLTKGDNVGSPKTLDYSDVVKLIGDKRYLFARKFSTSTEEQRRAVDFIYHSLKQG